MTPQATAFTSPPGLKAWIEKLQHINLPLLPGTRDAVIQQLHLPNASADSVARAVLQDPVLCLRLFFKAKRLLSKRGTEIHQIGHLVSMLGFPMIEQLITQAPEQKKEQDKTKGKDNNGYLEAISRSLFAAHLASQLSAHKPWLQTEELYFSTLFYQAHRWALWDLSPKAMQQRETLSIATGWKKADKSVLGTRPIYIASQLSNSWPMPALVSEAWQSDSKQLLNICARLHKSSDSQWWEQEPEIRQLLQSPQWIVMLTNQIADSASWDWHDRHCLRWYDLLAKTLHLPPEQLINETHRAAASLTLPEAIPRHCHPARLLLNHWQRRRWLTTQGLVAERPVTPAAPIPPVKQPVTAATENVETKESEKERQKEEALEPTPLSALLSSPTHQAFSNKVLLQTNIKRLSERGHNFANAHQLMNVVAETLQDGLGLDHTVIMMLNGERTLLRSYYNLGYDEEHPLAKLRLTIPAQTPGIFNKLLQQTGSLHVSDDNRQLVEQQLPPLFNQACDARDYALSSIFHHQKPIALIYIDRSNLDKALYRQFKAVCQASGKAIAAFARKPRRS